MIDECIMSRDARLIGLYTINNQNYIKSLKYLGENLKQDVKQKVNEELKTEDIQIIKDINEINNIQSRYMNRFIMNHQKQKIKEYSRCRMQMVECLKSKKYYDHDIYKRLDENENELGKFKNINGTVRLDNYVQNTMA